MTEDKKPLPQNANPVRTPTQNTGSKKSRGLGRGLDALLGERPSKIDHTQDAPRAVTTEKARRPVMPAKPHTGPYIDHDETNPDIAPDNVVPIEYIRANPTQPRKNFDGDALNDLAASIKSTGLLQPILVRPIKDAPKDAPRFEIVAGERRWRAAQKAGLHKVPVVIRSLDDQQTAEIALIENVQRVDLNPMEEAEAYHHLSKTYARSQEEIAQAVGKSRSHVANMMRLTGLTKAAREALANGVISAGHARALLSSPESALHLSETISKGLNVRQLEALIKRDGETEFNNKSGSKPKDRKTETTKDADTRALERDLAEAVGLEVSINHSAGGKGQVTVSYLDLDQLDDVCRRLMGSSA